MDYINKNRTLIGIILVIIIVAGSLLLIFSKPKQEDIKVTQEKESNTITIDIEGAINRPGVYELEMGALIQDIIDLAGGLTDEADHDKIAKEINRAQELQDGQKIYLPLKITSDSGSVAAEQTSDMININTANLNELDSLPGIGPAYAQRIIDYRTQNGGFSSIEEIMEIKGIGEKTFEKIREKITI